VEEREREKRRKVLITRKMRKSFKGWKLNDVI
jgi:hypothetical protein